MAAYLVRRVERRRLFRWDWQIARGDAGERVVLAEGTCWSMRRAQTQLGVALAAADVA